MSRSIWTSLALLAALCSGCIDLNAPAACTDDNTPCEDSGDATADTSTADSGADTKLDSARDAADAADTADSTPVDTGVDSTVVDSGTVDSSDAADTADTAPPVDTATFCTPLAYICAGAAGNELQRCRGDGSAYDLVATCPSAATCSPSLGRCSACTPGDISCSGQQLMKCDASGISSSPFGTACVSGTYCDPAGGGRCDPCLKNAFFCLGKNLRQCSADGASSSLIEACATPELCAASGASGCVAPSCTAGATRCSSKKVQTCNTAETAWTDTTTCPLQCGTGACLTVVEIATHAQSYVTCARLSDGSVSCWGWNGAGQIGDGSTSTGPFLSPTLVAGINAKQITVGGFAVGARLADGTVTFWGTAFDTLAVGTPASVAGVASAVDFQVGSRHACARISDSTVKCWGKNAVGQLGDATTTDRWVPTTITNLAGFADLELGQNFTCTKSSAVRCWGDNFAGQLGDGTTTARWAPTTLSGLPSTVQVAVGATSACAVNSSGSVNCWGTGPLGDGASQHLAPNTVGGLSSIAQVAVGSGHACALTTTGTVLCWGDNSNGQLGNGTTTTSATPVAVSGLSGVAQIVTGQGHTCARLTTGLVRCWGQNNVGQLGDGTTTNRSTPVAVTWP